MWMMNKLLELIFPKRPDYELIADLPTGSLCSHYCLQTHEGFDFLATYSSPTIRAAIHEAKFHNNEHAMDLLAELLKIYFDEKLRGENYLLLPIPLFAKRQKERGYNQVTEIVKRAISGHPNLKLQTDILSRTKHTKPQTKLAREDRLKNIEGVFSVKGSANLSGANVIILDDVVTTGATLNEARSAIAPLNAASVICVALAH